MSALWPKCKWCFLEVTYQFIKFDNFLDMIWNTYGIITIISKVTIFLSIWVAWF